MLCGAIGLLRCSRNPAASLYRVTVINSACLGRYYVNCILATPAPCYAAPPLQGAAKDVTKRYAANFIAASKHRDEAWWRAALAAAKPEALPPLLRAQLRAAAAAAPAAASGGAGGGAVAAGVASASGSGHTTATSVAIVGASTSGAARASGPSSTVVAASTASASYIAAGRGVAVASASTLADASVAATLRAAREDAEMEERIISQRRGMPMSIEGFKCHPEYILTRHVPKYAALVPGTQPIGLFKGERYYPRCAFIIHRAEIRLSLLTADLRYIV